MNTDIKGLLIYIFLILIVWLLPIAILYCGLLAYGLSDHYNDYIAMVVLLLTVVLFLLYILLPEIITYKAMKHQWSKYLDKFFYNNCFPTIILFILIALNFVLSPLTYEWILFYFLPYYCMIYLTIVIVRLINWYKNKY